MTIMNEVIENSIIFSEKGTEIVVEGTIDGDFYKMIVTDNGMGMDKKSINKIDTFKQFSKDVYRQEGIGIGLAVVKKTLKMFDGYLTVTGKENEYMKVEFGIPIA
jgi:K+-sensing histidine kinase KdpD